MAYIVGLLENKEMKKLEHDGWELEQCPAELIPDNMPLKDRGRMKMIWVDGSMFECMQLLTGATSNSD